MDRNSDCDDDYISPNQSKKIAFLGVFALLGSLPLTNAVPAYPGERIVEWVANGITWVIEHIATLLARAIFGSLGYIFAAGTEHFLFFQPPGRVGGLESAWFDFLPLFWAILPLSGAAFFLAMQLFPEQEEADIYRFMERTLVAVVALIVTGPVFTYDVPVPGRNDTIPLDLFSAAVFAVNEVGLAIFPDGYSMAFFGGFINAFMGGLAAIGGAVGAIVAIVFIGWKFLIAILLVVGTFWVVLAMRMLLIYTVYAMMPLLLALWIVDIGPMKYGKMVTGMMFKITGLLLLLGIIIAGILNTTSAIAGQDVHDDVEFTDEYDDEDPDVLIGDDGEIEDDEVTESEEPGGDASSADSGGGLSLAVMQIFAWLGGIVLSIAITTSLLGMVITARGASGTKSRLRQGRTPDAPSGPQVFGGGGGGSGGAGGGGGGPGGPVVTSTGDGDATVINTGDDGGAVMDSTGGMTTHAPENPEPDAVPVREKLGHAGRRAGGAVDKKTGGKLSDAADGIKKRGKSAYEHVPGSVKKAGNLAKRGGKAYWSVYKQPDPMSSLGEAKRIAQESPIGHPDARGEDGAAEASESAVTEDVDLGDDDEGIVGDEDDAGELDPAELETADIDELSDNPDKYEDGRFNLSNVEYQHEETVDISREGADEEKLMQKGHLVDPDSGESIESVGFNAGEDVPELEDGERYDMGNVGLREYDYDKYGGSLAHSGKTDNYRQVRADEHSAIQKKSVDDTGPSGGSGPAGDGPDDTGGGPDDTGDDDSERGFGSG